MFCGLFHISLLQSTVDNSENSCMFCFFFSGTLSVVKLVPSASTVSTENNDAQIVLNGATF